MTNLQIKDADIPSLEGKTAIVSGGASGIGWATVKILASKGARAHILDINPPDETLPPNVEFIKCNVTSWLELRGAFERVQNVDIAVANAGIAEKFRYFEDKFDEAGRLLEPQYDVLDVNYRSVLNFVKLSISYMRKSSGGSIVITSSSAAYAPDYLIPVYSSTKLALVGLMRGLRSSLPLQNISINCVAPGPTVTKIMPQQFTNSLSAAGLPVSSADVVGLAIAYSATARQTRRVEPYGKDPDEQVPGSWNGRTIYTLGDTYTELEEPIASMRSQWFGEENTHLTRMQQTLTDFREDPRGLARLVARK
ncbi:hypothetical protein MMC07_007410 [Pseudocyphellaria aurata]|nr:hypothetical protein [Pseudocyphellaria aurata]